MQEQWTQVTIQRHIDEQIEENLNLDYKAADALWKSPGKKKEITKDVSAMANSDGGIIIYGITEYQEPDQKHLPEKMDPVDRTQFSKEWLEQVINTIRPRMDGVVVHPVSLSSEPNGVIYVVEVPQSTTAHQARDYRYYKRFNFESVPMEDYEIRDVMSRATTPNAEVEFSSKLIGTTRERELYELEITLSNEGIQVISHFKLEFTFPDLSLVYLKSGGTVPLNDPPGGIEFNVKDSTLVSIRQEETMRRVICRSQGVLFPRDRVDLDTYVGLRYWFPPPTIRSLINLSLEWKLYADNMQLKQGHVPFYDLLELSS